MSLIQEISNDNKFVLDQLLSLTEKLSDSDYKKVKKQHGSSIGAHVRHIIEHYQSFFSASSVVNYDQRSRDTLLENSTLLANQAISHLLTKLASAQNDKAVSVICATNAHKKSLPVESSLARELVFLYSHTTHHMAIIKLLAADLSVSFSDDFGKAASTQAFESYVQPKLA